MVEKKINVSQQSALKMSVSLGPPKKLLSKSHENAVFFPHPQSELKGAHCGTEKQGGIPKADSHTLDAVRRLFSFLSWGSAPECQQNMEVAKSM